MPITQNQLINLMKEQNKPLISFLLKEISKDFKIDLDELNSRYLEPLLKIKRKRNSNKKGKKTGYTIFISEQNKLMKLKVLPFKQRAPEIADMWRSMSKRDKEEYKNQAIEFNKTVVNK